MSSGADPYAASLFHQPPLVLYLFSTTSHILPLQWGAIVIIAASDVVCAAFLYKASRESLFIPCAYLFNPISILSCLSLSGQALHMALVAGCLCPGLISCLSIATLAYVRCNPLLPFALVLSKSAMECPTGSCLGSRLLRNCVATGEPFPPCETYTDGLRYVFRISASGLLHSNGQLGGVCGRHPWHHDRPFPHQRAPAQHRSPLVHVH